MLKVHTLNDRVCPHFNNAAHGVEVPPGARLLFTNGQVGARPDGTVPREVGEQFEVIFERLGHVLAASHMGFGDVVRLSVYVTDKAHLEAFHAVRARHMKDHNPAATMLVVGPFPRPGVEAEVEVIAAKAG
jgi:enamine deaminase RidA (YjgF/YER057c/UK114 family)